MARQENLDNIFNSIFYSTSSMSIQNINPNNFDDSIVPTHIISGFFQILENEMKKSFTLDKILTEKNYIKRQEDVNAQVLSSLETLHKKLDINTSQLKKDIENNTIKVGKLYTVPLDTGDTFTYIFTGDKLCINHFFAQGKEAYYEIDNQGNVSDAKFPSDLSEYKVIIPRDLVFEETSNNLTNGFVQKKYKIKWGRTILTEKDTEGKLKHLNISPGGGEININHNDKVITIIPPVLSSID
ncbi:MAG TPA: hypothetical protein DCS13_02710 [Candidatus Margulisbacteria bacterium]|nr:hypothetical protein [Candidatus Margulisiibacteriota bacterium]